MDAEGLDVSHMGLTELDITNNPAIVPENLVELGFGWRRDTLKVLRLSAAGVTPEIFRGLVKQLPTTKIVLVE